MVTLNGTCEVRWAGKPRLVAVSEDGALQIAGVHVLPVVAPCCCRLVELVIRHMASFSQNFDESLGLLDLLQAALGAFVTS